VSPDVRRPTPEGIVLRPNESVLTRNQIRRLVQLNPLTELLNPVSYETNFGAGGKKFQPNSFDSIQVVWVQVTPGRKELLIKDGNHRASVVDENFDEIRSKYPNFQVVVRDVTSDHLEDKQPNSPPKPAPIPEELVINASAYEYPPAITTRQYMAITVDAMKLQKEILPLRVAALVMKRWNNIVGDELEEKFSGLAALTYLENPDIAHASEEDLDAYLKKQPQFFSGDTSQERIKLRNGLMTMASVIKDHGVAPSEAANSAFVILSMQGEGIGGPDAVKKQIAGILHLPVVLKKLQTGYGTGRELSGGIAYLTNRIAQALGTKKDPESVNREIRPIYSALVDPSFSFSDFTTILKTEPKKRQNALESIHTKIRIERFTQKYKQVTKSTKLSIFEESCIRDIVGKEKIVSDYIIDEILSAHRLREEAFTLLERLESTDRLGIQDKKELIASFRGKIIKIKASLRGISLRNLLDVRSAITEIKDFFDNPEGTTLFQRPEQQGHPQISRNEKENQGPATTEVIARRIKDRAYTLATDVAAIPAAGLDEAKFALRRLQRIIAEKLADSE